MAEVIEASNAAIEGRKPNLPQQPAAPIDPEIARLNEVADAAVQGRRYNFKETNELFDLNGIQLVDIDLDNSLHTLQRRKSNPQIGRTFLTDERFESLTITVKKEGANIIRGGEEVEKHLDARGASASIIGDTLLFRKNVTLSDVLEETYHFMQNKKGINADKPEPKRTYLNEIDAKKYLLKNAKKYKIPRVEAEETIEQLDYYEKLLLVYEGDE